MTPITIVDGYDPESRKDVLIEALYGAYQHLTRLLSVFSMMVAERSSHDPRVARIQRLAFGDTRCGNHQGFEERI
jgi:hypothetical protein